MPVLRLFAAAREAAGTSSAEVAGVTVDEVLAAARARFGPELGAIIDASKVWRNGEPATGTDPVGPTDEVAVLPPVSGGSGPDRPGRGRSGPDGERPGQGGTGGSGGGRSRRSTFAPAEPPPPSTPPPASRRSPAAEAANARRVERADRQADAADAARGRSIRPRPVASPDGQPSARRRPGPDGRAGQGPGPAPAGRRRPPSDGAGGRGRPPAGRADAPAGRGRPPAGRADGSTRTGGTARAGRSPSTRGRSGPPPAGRRAGAGGPAARRGDAAGVVPPARIPDGAPALTPERAEVTARAAGAPGRRPDLTKRPAATPPPLEPGVLTRTAAPTGRPLDPPADGDSATGRATRLTRMRSVGVPVTGSVTLRGKERQVSGVRARRTALGRRYAVVYDTDGPKVTLGVLWFVAAIGGVYLGWWALTFLFAIAAGWAAMEAADRWREQGVAADPWVAALGAGAVAAAGAAGAGFVGVAILVVVLVSLARMGFSDMGRDHVVSAAGNTVGCAIPFGLASASVVLANDLEIGAVVALLLFVFAYDAGDYLIGSGSSNSIEGPVTGIVTIGVVAMALVVLGTPPFEGVAAYTFAVFAAVLCPLGQMAASALLPANDARAPSVRRLDSFLLLAPVWVWSVGIFMGSR